MIVGEEENVGPLHCVLPRISGLSICPAPLDYPVGERRAVRRSSRAPSSRLRRCARGVDMIRRERSITSRGGMERPRAQRSWVGSGDSGLASLIFVISAVMKLVGGRRGRQRPRATRVAGSRCSRRSRFPSSRAPWSHLDPGDIGPGRGPPHRLHRGRDLHATGVSRRPRSSSRPRSGIFVWLGIYLREERLRALLPLRRSRVTTLGRRADGEVQDMLIRTLIAVAGIAVVVVAVSSPRAAGPVPRRARTAAGSRRSRLAVFAHVNDFPPVGCLESVGEARSRDAARATRAPRPESAPSTPGAGNSQVGERAARR